VANVPLSNSNEAPPSGRARRARASLPVYNLVQLAGAQINRKRAAVDGAVDAKRRRTVSGDTTAHFREVTDASARDWSTPDAGSPRGARLLKRSQPSPAGAAQISRRATRLSGAPVETLATKLASLGKKGKKALEKSLPRELRRLQDTNEFAHIETRPVRYSVWSNGKYIEVDPAEKKDEKKPEEEVAAASPARKKVKFDGGAAAEGSREAVKPEAEAAAPAIRKRRVKKFLEKGLYAGQETPTDLSKSLTTKEKKKLATIPELVRTSIPNKVLPTPMFNGLRLLINGRDFKLPYDVCNPLPPGQPKPAAYRTMTRSECLPPVFPVARHADAPSRSLCG
jgi:[histone H3]-lysine4 N-trimethyltransferase ASH1L